MTPSQKRKCRAREDAIVGVYDEYALKGGVGNAVGLDKDEIEARIENAWFCCRVDRKELKRLITRRDGPALRHFGLWAVLLSGSGALAFLAWPSPWCIPAFLAYGVLYSVSDHHSHELSHGTVFRTRWINEVLLRVAGFMTLHESYYWRWSHARHHTETIIVGRDPEIAFPRPPDSGALLDFFFIKSGIQQIHNIVTHAFGTLKPSAEEFIPETERKKVVRVSRAYTTVFIAVIAACVATASVLPALFVVLPRFYGGFAAQMFNMTQHAGLAENVHDHRLNSRTVLLGPVSRFLYMNMNYHIEHHMFPMVPFHALPRAHELIKDQCPPPYRGLIGVYREIIPALLRQRRDSTHHVVRPLPAQAASA